MKEFSSKTLKREEITRSTFSSSAIIFPGKYIQGPGSLNLAGEVFSSLGNKLLIFGGEKALKAVETVLVNSFKKAGGIKLIREVFGGICTQSEIDRLISLGRKNNVDAVIGVGGGMAVDTAKAVAHYLCKPVGLIPTIASTDAPISALSVVYTNEGKFDGYISYNRNPDVILVDTEIIAKAPVRFFISGMGGAIGVSYEAETCYKSGAKTLAGGSPSLLAVKCAQMAREILLKYGYMAKISVENGVWSPAVERCIEANLLLSGIGFESGGLAIAHSIYHGYRSLNKKKAFHGEVVAFGTLVEMILEDNSINDITRIIKFFKDVGLPCTLKEIEIDRSDGFELEKLALVASKQGTASNMNTNSRIINSRNLLDAIISADCIGSIFLQEENII